ncbi:putative dock, partial [Fasciola gigantica]
MMLRPSVDLYLSDKDDHAMFIDYEPAHPSTREEASSTPRSSNVTRSVNMESTHDLLSEDFTESASGGRLRRFFSADVSLTQSTAFRLLGPGSSPDLPRSFSTQFSDPTLFLLADFLKLQIDQGETEPVFGRAFLFNVHSRSRISETFHFDTNSDNLLSLFTASSSDQQIEYRELTTMSKTGLFRVSQQRETERSSPTISGADVVIRNPARSAPLGREVDGQPSISGKEESDYFLNSEGSILAPKEGYRQLCRTAGSVAPDSCFASGTFLVIRIDKVLQQGDIGDILELYNKEEKNKQKLRSIVYWCCQRLGRYRMPLAWTAIDLTALWIEAKRMKMPLENQTVRRRQSRTPQRRSPESGNRGERIDKRSHSVGAKHGGPRMSHLNSDQLDALLSVTTPREASAFMDSTELSVEAYPFVNVDLNVNTFYRWEWDKPCDEELARCLSDVHRNTLAKLAVLTVTTRSPTVSGEPSFGRANVFGNVDIADLLNPNPATLKRLKTAPNLNLRLRLHVTESFHLPTLLKVVGANRGKSHQDFKSPPLLSPESLPYHGPFFRTYPRLSNAGNASSHGALDKLGSRRRDTSACNLDAELRPIREVLELPSPQVAIPFTSYSSPDLYDEIKIQLPSHVDENLYLLFTFYHVSCQFKKVESNATLDTVIGYSYHMDAFKWVDAHRELFRVSTLAVSSVCPGDACVEMLLSACLPNRALPTVLSFTENESWVRLARCITNASLSQLVAFLAPLLDGLFRLLTVILLYQPSEKSAELKDHYSLGFSTLYLLSLMSERLSISIPEWNDPNGRNRLLVGYLAGAKSVRPEQVFSYHFDGSPLLGLPCVEELLDGVEQKNLKSASLLPREFLQLFLSPNEAADERIERIPVASWWFVFETLIRLLMEYAPFRSAESTKRSSPSKHQRKQSLQEPLSANRSPLYNETDAVLKDLKLFISTFARRLILRIGIKTESESRADRQNDTSDTSRTFNQLDKVAILYVVMLDIGCQLVNRVVETWKTVLVEQRNTKLTTEYKESNSMDDMSDKSGTTTSDSTLPKNLGKRRRTVPKIPKASLLNGRFASPLLEVGLSESGKSSFVLLPDDLSDRTTERLSEPVFEHVWDKDAMRRWLMCLLWIMRYTPALRPWRRVAAKDLSRELHSPRLGALVESVVGSTTQTNREGLHNRSNSCTPIGAFSKKQSVTASRESRLCSVSSLLASEFALSVAEILDQLIW